MVSPLPMATGAEMRAGGGVGMMARVVTLAVAELTSRVSSAAITTTLDQMAVPFDPAYGLSLDLPGGEIMWGEGEHRYLAMR